MKRANERIRSALRMTDVKQWQLAAALGIAEETLCRRLRTELPEDISEQMLEKIKEIAAQKEE